MEEHHSDGKMPKEENVLLNQQIERGALSSSPIQKRHETLRKNVDQDFPVKVARKEMASLSGLSR